jgi:sulfur-carrier protein adenylyltransferase/sulfurtransferase
VKLICSADQVTELKPAGVKAALEKDKKGEFILLDVRTPEEFQIGHIPGARLIPIGELEARHKELDKTKKIITYCRSGHRSMAASVVLCGLGFPHLYHLEGGLKAWNFEVEAGSPGKRPAMISGNEAVADILMVAMKMEKGAWTFYSRAKEKMAGTRSAELFGMLAQVEEGHLELIYHRYIETLGEGSLPPLKKLKQELTAEYMEGNIEVNKELLRLERVPFKDELEAHEVALEIEYLSLDFYNRSAALVTDPKSSQVLRELGEADRRHIALITEMLSRLVKPQGLAGA